MTACDGELPRLSLSPELVLKEAAEASELLLARDEAESGLMTRELDLDDEKGESAPLEEVVTWNGSFSRSDTLKA